MQYVLPIKSDCHAMSQNLAIVVPGLRIANIKSPIHPPATIY